MRECKGNHHVWYTGSFSLNSYSFELHLTPKNVSDRRRGIGEGSTFDLEKVITETSNVPRGHRATMYLQRKHDDIKGSESNPYPVGEASNSKKIHISYWKKALPCLTLKRKRTIIYLPNAQFFEFCRSSA
jgi:hypothetical protein